jgi:hypothetical protein
MIRSPGIGLNHDPMFGGPLGTGFALWFKEGPLFSLASIGVSVSWPRTGGADGEKYNYGEIVSRVKPIYSDKAFT